MKELKLHQADRQQQRSVGLLFGGRKVVDVGQYNVVVSIEHQFENCLS